MEAHSSRVSQYGIHTTAEIVLIQTLSSELEFHILCDNMSTLTLAHKPILQSCTKHMEINIFFVRENVVAYQNVDFSCLVVDVLTKVLSPTLFVTLVKAQSCRFSCSPPLLSLHGCSGVYSLLNCISFFFRSM